jgi:hypothetical protein
MFGCLSIDLLNSQRISISINFYRELKNVSSVLLHGKISYDLIAKIIELRFMHKSIPKELELFHNQKIVDIKCFNFQGFTR